MLKRLSRAFKKRGNPSRKQEPHIVLAAQHPIVPADISRGAAEVVQTLEQAGFSAFVVGGCVRDLLLGLHPKDFDVATNATPEQVKDMFRRARIIGRRFRIVHVPFGREVVEVTTFRAHHGSAPSRTSKDHARRGANGMLLRDNVFGSIDEDAARRDFTINALYYHPTDNTIYDYANGLVDIENRVLRIIGDPLTRYQEDPVRMLRAARFSARLDFQLDPESAVIIPSSAQLLAAVSPARLFDETLKLFMAGYAAATWQQLEQLRLVEQLFPTTAPMLENNDFYQRFINQALHNTDERIHQDKRVTPAFLFAALLWPAVCETQTNLESSGRPRAQARQQAIGTVIASQIKRIAIPRRFTLPMREIWDLQGRFFRRGGQQPQRLLTHPRFRAAYDFILLREQSGEDLDGLGEWWTRFQEVDADEQETMIKALGSRGSSRKRRPRNRKPRTDAH